MVKYATSGPNVMDLPCLSQLCWVHCLAHPNLRGPLNVMELMALPLPIMLGALPSLS